MVIMKKEICLKRNDEIIEKLKKLETINPETVSLRKFIDINFQDFVSSGKSTREIYEFLKEEKVDVSSFQVFKNLYSQVKKSRKQAPATPVSAPTPKEFPAKTKELTQVMPINGQKVFQTGGEPNVRREPQPDDKISKNNPMLPPVFLPGGVEAIVDPTTGARRFEIKSGKD